MSRHLCHYPDCKKQVPPRMWGCQIHWFRLPLYLRNKVWRAYKPGQEIRKDPSPQYMEVMQEVKQWINEKKILY